MKKNIYPVMKNFMSNEEFEDFLSALNPDTFSNWESFLKYHDDFWNGLLCELYDNANVENEDQGIGEYEYWGHIECEHKWVGKYDSILNGGVNIVYYVQRLSDIKELDDKNIFYSESGRTSFDFEGEVEWDDISFSIMNRNIELVCLDNRIWCYKVIDSCRVEAFGYGSCRQDYSYDEYNYDDDLADEEYEFDDGGYDDRDSGEH